jgi:hypothetical protein
MTDNTLNAGSKVNSRSRKFLVHHGLMREGPSSAAVFWRKVGKQDACLTYCSPGFVVRAVLLAPAGLMRQEFLIDELVDGFSEHPQFVIQPRGLICNVGHLEPFNGS